MNKAQMADKILKRADGRTIRFVRDKKDPNKFMPYNEDGTVFDFMNEIVEKKKV